MNLERFTIAFALTLASTLQVSADQIAAGRHFRCPVPTGFRAIKLNTEVPPALLAKLKGIALLHEDWNTTDVTDDRPREGIEFVMTRGNWWIIGVGQVPLSPAWKYARMMCGTMERVEWSYRHR